MIVPGGGINLGKTPQRKIEQHRQLLRQKKGADPTGGIAGVTQHLLRPGEGDLAGQPGSLLELRTPDPDVAAGHHQQRLVADQQ